MDKRKNNGNKGHSTKTSGIDKRKNEYREAIGLAANVDDVKDVLIEILKQSKGGDLTAAKLLLSYCLGMPKQQIEQKVVNVDKEITKEEIRQIKEEFFKKY